jgi:hypothetical protein
MKKYKKSDLVIGYVSIFLIVFLCLLVISLNSMSGWEGYFILMALSKWVFIGLIIIAFVSIIVKNTNKK